MSRAFIILAVLVNDILKLTKAKTTFWTELGAHNIHRLNFNLQYYSIWRVSI